jgi:hypothetical protein
MMIASGTALTEILLGREDILTFLFPGGSMHLAIQLYEEDVTAFTCNHIVVEAVRSLCIQT